MAEEVGVVCVEEGAVDDALGEIRAAAAIADQFRLDAEQCACGIGRVADAMDEAVALAGLSEVLAARHAVASGPVERARHQCGEAGEGCRLTFLAAEAAAHPPGLRDDARIGQIEHARDEALDVARVLRGRHHVDAFLGRPGEGDLSLEIEVFLPRDDEFERARVDISQRCRRITEQEVPRREHVMVRFVRCDGVENRIGWFVLDVGEREGTARDAEAVGGDCEQGLASEQHFAVAEQRITAEHGPDVEGARDVRVSEHRTYARCATHCIEVHAQHAARGDGGGRGRDLDFAGARRHVVDVARAPRHVMDGGLVRGRAGRPLGDRKLGGTHARPSSLLTSSASCTKARAMAVR